MEDFNDHKNTEDVCDSKTALLGRDQNKIVHEKKRWYILGVFIMLAFTQSLIWTMWGPIAASAEFAFGWTNSTIALLGNWGCIVPILTMVPATWIMSQKGFRISCVITASAMLLGSSLKCISSLPHMTWLIHVGQILNNIGVPVTLAGPPVLSSIWFPAHQRTTATALATGLGFAGESMAFVLGPLLVPELPQNDTCYNISSLDYNRTDCEYKQSHIRTHIMHLMYIECAMTAVAFLFILIYFPAKPKNSPSITSSLSRTELKQGVFDLMKNPMFWILTLVFATGGNLWGWFAVLDITVRPLGVTEQTVGWMGFLCGITPQLTMIPVGYCSDIFAKKMKITLLVFYSIGLVSALIFALSCAKIIPYKIEVLFVSSILCSIASYSGLPLLYEMLSECTYPVSEAVTNNITQAAFNFTTFIFFIIFMFPNVGTAWTNWVLVGSISMSIPLLCVFKEEYKRLDIDVKQLEIDVDKSNIQ